MSSFSSTSSMDSSPSLSSAYSPASSTSSSASSDSSDSSPSSSKVAIPCPRTIQRFRATLLLGAVGDTMGYHNGDWEFCYDTKLLRTKFRQAGGLDKIQFGNLLVSDDTVLHLATIEAMLDVGAWKDEPTKLRDQRELEIASRKLLHAYDTDMKNRAPGTTTGESMHLLRRKQRPAFNLEHKTCGGSMRAAGIGLKYSENLPKLIWTSIEYCRLTHNGPIAYMGSYLNALFTSYAINRISPMTWLARALETQSAVLEHVRRHSKSEDFTLHEGQINWIFDHLTFYSEYRFPGKIYENEVLIGDWDPTLPYFRYDYMVDPDRMDSMYKALSNEPTGKNHWSGSGGFSSVMIAYDALLHALYNHGAYTDEIGQNLYTHQDQIPAEYWNQAWSQTVTLSMLHSGDNDSTGIIAGGWYGALFGARGVTMNLLKDLEYFDRIWKLAEQLHASC